MIKVCIYSHFTGALQVRGVHRVRFEFQRQRDADRLHRKSSISAKELLEREMALPMDRHFFLSNSRVERPPQSPSTYSRSRLDLRKRGQAL